MRRTTLVNAEQPVAGEEREARDEGSLKLFFSYAPASGATMAMLDEAKSLMASGRDVLITEFDLHGSATGAAFDVEAALKRKPDVVVLENLSHANPAGSRNRVRFQDAEELLRAGVDVYATMRVSDLRNEQDRVAALGLEGPADPVPDYLFYGAQQLEFVDIDPVELTARCRATGRAVIDPQVLGELRIMALRCVGEYTASANLAHIDPTGVPAGFRDRVVAVVDVHEAPRDVLLAAARIAALSHAPLEAVCVRPPASRERDAHDAHRDFRSLAEQVEAMGFTLETLYGDDPAEAVRDYLRAQGASDVVLARHRVSRARRMLMPVQLPFDERIVDNVADIQVHLVPTSETADPRRLLERGLARLGDFGVRDVAAAAALVLLAALIARSMVSAGFGDVVSYLLWIPAVCATAALTRSYAPSVLAAVAAALLQDYLFIRPYSSFAIDHRASAATFAFAIAVLLVLAFAVCRMARASERSRRRERHTQALFDLNRSLVYAHGVVEVVDISTDALARLFDRSVAFYVRDPMARPSRIDARAAHVRALPGDLGQEDFARLPELAIVHWVFCNGESAGDGTSTNGESYVYYMPLSKRDEVLGVIGVSARKGLDLGDRSYLELVTNQIVLAFERQTLLVEHVDDVRRSRAVGVREAFVTGVLQSASRAVDLVHELGEPLVKGSGDPAYREALARACSDETARAHLMCARVLAVTQACDVEADCDVRAEVARAVEEVAGGLGGKRVVLEQAETAPHVFADAALVRLAAQLILEVATSYVGKGGTVEVAVRDEEGRVSVIFSDDRPGTLGNVRPGALLAEGGSGHPGDLAYDAARAASLREVFRDAALMTGEVQELLAALAKAMRVPEEVLRAEGEDRSLNRLRLLRFDRLEYGLYMAALIVHAHGGTIKQRYRLGGGAVISFTLPKER